MVNKVILIGNLGRDPETRYTQNGTQVTTFSVATTERWRGQDGQQQEQTEWHRIVTWRRLAEICAQYLHKGSKVYIEGKLQTRKWQDQQSGQERYTTEIVANEMKMLDSRGGSGGGDYGDGSAYGGGGGYGGDQGGYGKSGSSRGKQGSYQQGSDMGGGPDYTSEPPGYGGSGEDVPF